MSQSVPVPAQPIPSELDVLIAAIARGDHGAFSSFYRVTLPSARRAAQRILGPRDGAQDAVQEAYLRVWEAAPRYRPSNARGWLTRIVTNVCLDALRRGARLDVAPPQALVGLVDRRGSDEPDGAGCLVERSLAHIAEQGWFSALGDRDQRILLLVALGFANHEIRALLDDVRHNQVIRRAMARARRNWKAAHPEDSRPVGVLRSAAAELSSSTADRQEHAR